MGESIQELGGAGFRPARGEDLPAILAVIEQAKAYLKSRGVDQWQNGYPNAEVIGADIARGRSYVLEWQGRVAGTVAVLPAPEKNYAAIYDGAWRGGEEYAVIHRIAVDGSLKGKGAAGEMLRRIEALCRGQRLGGIRVDTHERNASMRRLLQKTGFFHCGRILLEDGSARVAYEKLLEP